MAPNTADALADKTDALDLEHQYISLPDCGVVSHGISSVLSATPDFSKFLGVYLLG
jgi:hypothetical protein